MDYLQYSMDDLLYEVNRMRVLNLIINGLPSIHRATNKSSKFIIIYSFKPYYKWITFNTLAGMTDVELEGAIRF